VHALVFAMADDVALRLGARDHLLHVAAAQLLQRLAGQDMERATGSLVNPRTLLRV
jgi:hypothetical protein